MLSWQKVYAVLVLASPWMEEVKVAAKMTTFYAPSHRHMLSGKTMIALMEAHETWNDASFICRNQFKDKGGTLVRIDSQMMMEVIDELTGGMDVWIGLHWHNPRPGKPYLAWNDFTCSKVENGDYTNFVDPSMKVWETNTRCYFTQQGTWRRQICNYHMRFLCEYQETATDEITGCSSSEPFSPVNADLYHVTMAATTDDICMAECASTLGCFITMVYSDSLCVMAVVGDTESTIYVRNRCLGGTTYNSSSIQSISTSNLNVSPEVCTPLNASFITVTDQIITDDSRGLGGGGGGGGVLSSAIAPTTTAVTQTVTETLPASTEVLTTAKSFKEKIVKIQHEGMSATPVIKTVTETVTQTQIVTAAATTAAPIAATTIIDVYDTTSTTYFPGPSVETVTVQGTAADTDGVTLTPSSCPTLTSCPTVAESTTTVTASTVAGGGGGGVGGGGTWSIDCSGESVPTATVIETVCPSLMSSLLPSPMTTSAVNNNNNTICPTAKNITLNHSELQQVTESIVQELIVPTESLSQTRRKKESAPDQRTSAQTSGYFAIFCLTFTFGGVLIADFPVFFIQIKELIGKTRQSG